MRRFILFAIPVASVVLSVAISWLGASSSVPRVEALVAKDL